MKASPIQNNFIGGEFSPLTLARIDSDLYPTGLAKCFNYIPLIQGQSQDALELIMCQQ